MGLFRRTSFSAIIQRIFGKKHAKIGIYGPPNVGKTTLANRILRDWTGDIMGSVSEIPHETRTTKCKKNVKVENGNSSLLMDIIDTPGIATKVDFKDFMNTYGLNKEEAKNRAKEATEGVIESIRWLENVDGVLLVMDSTQDPFTQVNVTILGMDERTKELLGLATSTVLKCDDCVTYHIVRCVQLGLKDDELLEALNVALVVGGSITIPHIRRAVEIIDSCRELQKEDPELKSLL